MNDSQKIAQPIIATVDDTTQNNLPMQSPGRSSVQQTSQQQPAENEEEIIEIPVSIHSKEGGPSLPTSHETLLRASMPELEISPDLKKEGVEVVTETPKLMPEDAAAGIVHAKESVPVSTTPTATIVLPMTQQQAQQTVKIHKKVKDSLFWFAMLIARQWKVAEKQKK